MAIKKITGSGYNILSAENKMVLWFFVFYWWSSLFLFSFRCSLSVCLSLPMSLFHSPLISVSLSFIFSLFSHPFYLSLYLPMYLSIFVSFSIPPSLSLTSLPLPLRDIIPPLFVQTLLVLLRNSLFDFFFSSYPVVDSSLSTNSSSKRKKKKKEIRPLRQGGLFFLYLSIPFQGRNLIAFAHYRQ